MTQIEVVSKDITKLDVDAIVNAANARLAGGGGVDAAIHTAAGPELLEACQAIVSKQGKCKTGEAVITKGFELPARYVIHTVGPICDGRLSQKAEDRLLKKSYTSSLDLAKKYRLSSVAFSNISTGVYGFPKERAAVIVRDTVTQWVAEYPDSLDTIIFSCFNDENLQLYRSIFGS